jgi:hypothetical protein
VTPVSIVGPRGRFEAAAANNNSDSMERCLTDATPATAEGT